MSEIEDIQKNLIAKTLKMAEQARAFNATILPKIFKIRDGWRSATANQRRRLADDIRQFAFSSSELLDNNFFGLTLRVFLTEESAGRLYSSATVVILYLSDIKSGFGKVKKEPMIFKNREAVSDFCKNWEKYWAELKALPNKIESNEAKIELTRLQAEHAAKFPFKDLGEQAVNKIIPQALTPEAVLPSAETPDSLSGKRGGEKQIKKVPLAEQPRDITDYKKMKF